MLSEQFMNPKRVRPMYPAQRAFLPVSNMALAAGKFNHNPMFHTKEEEISKNEAEDEGILQTYCKETTLHGWKYFVKPGSPKWERIYWLVVIFVFYSILSKSLWDQVINFAQRPTLISFEPEPVYISNIPIPAVSLCPDMQLRKSYFNLSQFIDTNLNLTEEQSRHLYLSLFVCSLTLDDVMPPAFDFSPDLLFDFGKAHVSLDNCRSFIKSASIGFKELEDPCWYFQSSFSEFGSCFSFNMLPANQLLKSDIDIDKYSGYMKSPGLGTEVVWTPDSGYLPGKMEIVPVKNGNPPISASDDALSVGIQLSLQMPSHLFDPRCLGGRGFHGYIHNPSHIPTTGQYYFYLAPSEEIDAKVTPQVSTISDDLLSWTPESRQCYMQNERKLAFFAFYTQSNCQVECESNFTLETCNCIIHYRPRFNNTPVCGPKFWVCLGKNSELTDSLDCNCLPSCNDISYTATFTTLNQKLEENNASSDGMIYMNLKVSYTSKFVQGIRRSSSKQLTELIADVGGLLGLLTGFGMLSLVEMLYFLFLKQRKKSETHSASSVAPNFIGPYRV